MYNSANSLKAPLPPEFFNLMILGIDFILSTALLGHALTPTFDNNSKQLTSSPIYAISDNKIFSFLQNSLMILLLYYKKL